MDAFFGRLLVEKGFPKDTGEAIKPERRATESILKVCQRVGSAWVYQGRKDVKRSEEGRKKVGRFSFLVL